MSNPFAVQPSQTVVQGQGIGGSITAGLAGVLAQMQLTRENQFKQQELEIRESEVQAKVSIAEMEAESRLQVAELQHETQAMKMAEMANISMETVQADLTKFREGIAQAESA